MASMIEHGVRASPPRTLGSIGEAGAIHSRHNSSEQSQKPMGSVPENQWQVIADVVKQLSQVASNLSGASQGTFNVSSNTPQPTVQTPDWSKINLVLKSDIKEPPYFRGDSTDQCTVTEWQEMMQAYLIKKSCSVPEQGREILDRLMGRAKDIARIGIRNNPLINISRDPDAIYSMLRQHFGEAISSTTPLADFYSTLPRQSETSMDYWIRLNKAVDLANDCLLRQGKRVEDPSHEVTMMFVKHCPDPAL